MSRRIVWALLLTGVLVLLGPETTPAQSDDSQAEMKAYMEMMAPGPHHEYFQKVVGTWNLTSRAWMSPDQPPMESTGISTIETVMGGRFLEETVKANLMGIDWEGRGVFGYDTGIQKHVGVWYDALGTMIMTFAGDCDGTCSTITTYSDYFDPMTQSNKRMKAVATSIDDDHWTNEMFELGPEGQETKMMVIEYTRAK